MNASCRGMPRRVCAAVFKKKNQKTKKKTKLNKPFHVKIYRILRFPPILSNIIPRLQQSQKKSFVPCRTLTRTKKCDRKWMNEEKMWFLPALNERYLFPISTKLACLTRFSSFLSCFVICVIIKGSPLGNKHNKHVLKLIKLKVES